MSKKPAPKKPAAKKPAPAADKKKPKAPVAKAPVKPVAKPAAKAPVKPAAKSVPAKAAAKPATKVVGKAPVKPAAPVSAKGAKAAAPVAAKGAKPVKETKASHEAQKKLLDTHRKEHEQSGALDVAPRAKLQFFTLNELRELLKKRKNVKLNLWVPDEERKAREKAAAAARSHGNRSQNIGAASIADLLGTNPFRKGTGYVDESKQIPEKFRRYYKLLEDMREALQKGLAFHSEEALKKSGKDDAGDLSGYSQHLADAGTDTADRDFALSLISNEQEALKEINDAVERMKNGSYGVCEITGKPIPPARLLAVPFTRYSLEGQKELERNRRAHRRRGGNPLGEIGDEVGFGTGGGGGEDEPSDS